MARFSLGGLLAIVGFALLLHTTYSVIQYRQLLKLLQQEYESLPSSLIGELMLGASLATAGAYLLSGNLRSIVSNKQSRSMDVGSLRTDFVSFNLRSRAFATLGQTSK